MTVEELINEIKVDLGCDINSLGISDNSIELKIGEALRKISQYAPYVSVESYTVSGGVIDMPEDATGVINILNTGSAIESDPMKVADDTDLFSVSRYLYNYNDLSDPYIFLTQRTAVKTLQSFVSLEDYRFDKVSHKLFVTNHDGENLTVKYFRKYRSLDEIQDVDIQQIIKEYSLALCKIIEGNIRRKLQSAPGAIQLDGDSLVSEGTSEKQNIESRLAREFQHIRFGLRV